jgi:DNA-binding NtrC family response regulator/tetratricopeptide (TPR) repeat protein
MTSPLAALHGESARIKAIRAQVAQVLARQAGGRRLPPIMLLGETGTGKGLLARTIHQAGPRRDGPFVDVNCAAIPETLLEAELFGYERGAFTDARQAKPGLFQTAHGGTLFLDEIGLLPVALQGKLLGVLEDRAVRRLGSTRAQPVDVALIAATAVDLKRAVSDGNFRADLYHRLAVICLELPPLRARGGDILALGEHFLARVCADYGLSPRTLTSEARDLLLAYPWPGNVRELSNAMERVVLLSDTDAITPEMLDFLASEDLSTREAGEVGDVAATAPRESLDAALRARIEAALRNHGGNIRRTADTLGISRNTLRARMDKYGLRHRDRDDRVESSPASVTPEPGTPVQWERRWLAFLRARVRCSARVEAAGTLEVISGKIRSFGGRIEESGPSDVVAVFGLEPVDNAPSHASLAALAIQKAAAPETADAGNVSNVIVAIHCAEYLVSRHESTARIAVDGKAATWSLLEALVTGHAPGEIVISGAVVPFLTRRFALEPARGEQRDAWLVLRRVDTSAAWSARRFVGRTSELETLRQASARAEQRRGQIVGMVGEAGVGKSRLLYEAVRTLTGWLVLASGGAPYAKNTPYSPIVEMLKILCGVSETDTAVEVREKVARGVPVAASEPDGLTAPVLDLLGVLPSDHAFRALDPAKRRRRTHEAVKEVFLTASLAQPLCLIVEDLHWIDSETQATLDLLAESIAASRVLLLVNYRPEYQHGWGSRSVYSQVRLDPLATDGMEELLVALLGADSSLAALKERLIERTEGNPFFLEECVRTLAETGAIVGETSAYRLGTVTDDVVLPMTVQAVIAARIDRLSREEKLVLQSAAVIGKDLRVAVLRSIAEVTGASFEAILASLRHAEFVQETRVDPDPEYTFTHALTQEVAYGSVLHDRRRDLHARIMETLEREYPDRLTEQVDRLAHHAFHGEAWPKALAYLRQAGAQAATRSAYREAVIWFEQALVAVAHLAESRDTIGQTIDVQLELQGPLAAVGQTEKLRDYLGRAKALAVTLEDRSRLARVLALECSYLRAAHEFDRAIEVGERAATIATDLGETDLQAIARYGLGVTFHDLGDFVRARDVLRRVVEALDPSVTRPTDGQRMGLGLSPTTIMVRPRAWLTLTLGYLGQFVEGIALGEQAVRIAESGDHEFDCIVAANALGSLYVIKGDLGRAIPRLECSLALARTWGSVGWSTVGCLGQAYAQSERYDEAFRLLRDVVGASKQMMDEVSSSRFRQLGEIYLLAGRLAEASQHAGQALDLARDRKQRGCEALALRLVGQVASHRDRFGPGEAEECCGQALGLAGELGMRPLVAQCHLDLGTLYRRTGRHGQAREHLAAATTMFREMDMTYWLEKLETQRRDAGDRLPK